MSVPLDAIAVCDTTERITEARELQEYRRLARLEFEHILAFQRELPTTIPLPTTPQLAATTTLNDLTISPIEALFPTTPSPSTSNKTPTTPTTSNTPPTPPTLPTKVATQIKRVLGLRKKPSSTDDFSDIRRAMGSERLERGDPARLRTAGPTEGGQLPGEDSWEWYVRSVGALPGMEGRAGRGVVD